MPGLRHGKSTQWGSTVTDRQEIQRQQKEAEELGKTPVTLARLRKLLREQGTYEAAAFEESANTLMGELSYTGRRFAAIWFEYMSLTIGIFRPGVAYRERH
jgi:hypothetical protein